MRISDWSSDVCSSDLKIISQLPRDQKIIFGPDRHLGAYLNRVTGRDMLLWPGACIVHEAFSETELLKLKAQHPDAPVDRKSTRLNSSHQCASRMPSSA